MSDEHENIHSERIVSRRKADAETGGEVRLLRQEIETLRENLGKDETNYEERLTKLELDYSEFQRKITYGKGFFYGVGGGIATFVYFFADTMKTAFAHIMNLTK